MAFAGVIAGAGIDLSDVGGDGGVCVSEAIEETDFVGGVAFVGDDAAVSIGECSDKEECDLGIIAASGVGFRRRDLSAAASACRSLSCRTSASTLRSDNSSRSLWFSMRSSSLSFSPVFISSSSITFLSMATLNLDSKSSKEDVVFLACLS